MNKLRAEFVIAVTFLMLFVSAPLDVPDFSQATQQLPRIEFDSYEEVPETSEVTIQEALERQGEEPLSITIPGISISDVPVIEVGLEPDRSMEIPEDVFEIGWYTPLDVRPGDTGNAVMAGHVDSREQGAGAFFYLSTLEVGDMVEIETDTSTQYWQITSVTNYDKDYLPFDEIFTISGDPGLVLVTCGGEFDSDTRNYLENTVATAELMEED